MQGKKTFKAKPHFLHADDSVIMGGLKKKAFKESYNGCIFSIISFLLCYHDGSASNTRAERCISGGCKWIRSNGKKIDEGE